MTHLEPHPLWVGHEGDGRDFRRLFDAGIQAVVQLAIEVPPLATPREMISLRYPVYDGPGNDPCLLALAIDTLVTLLRTRTPTLVCCAAGMGRSPAITAAALARTHGEAPEAWLEWVAERHPSDVPPALWNEVRSAL